MASVDDRINVAAARLRAHTSRTADTDAAWHSFAGHSGRGRRSPPGRGRAGRSVSIGTAIALVAAGIFAVVIVRRHDDRTEQQRPATGATTLRTSGSTDAAPTIVATPTTRSAPTSTATIVPTSAATATTVLSQPKGVRLPSGRTILSASIPDAVHGWLIVDGPSAPTLQRTSDAGVTWIETAIDAQPTAVRFADTNDGWLVTDVGLRSTHDGGLSWKPVSGPPVEVKAIANDATAVHLVGYSTNENAFEVFTSPTDHDAFTASPVRMPPGAGPLADFSIALQGGHGWIVLNDRVVITGARLVNGVWQPWTPPCSNATGTGELFTVAVAAAPAGRQLVAACSPSPFGAQQAQVRVFLSNDGGATFISAALPDLRSGSGSIQTVFVIHDGIIAVIGVDVAASGDGGATWVHPDLPSFGIDSAVAWTDGTAFLPLNGAVIISDDDGATWHSPVG